MKTEETRGSHRLMYEPFSLIKEMPILVYTHTDQNSSLINNCTVLEDIYDGPV
jgi:hypothetical protein